MACSFISPLLFRRRPPAISRLIIAIVVRVAVNRMCRRWSRPNVSKKVFKRVTPALANGNPATAVVDVHFERWVCASVNHSPPYPILRRVGASVCFGSLGGSLTNHAAARLSCSALKIASSDCFGCGTTRTPADPHRTKFALAGVFYDCQSAKYHPGQVLKSFIGWLYNCVRHALAPCSLSEFRKRSAFIVSAAFVFIAENLRVWNGRTVNGGTK